MLYVFVRNKPKISLEYQKSVKLFKIYLCLLLIKCLDKLITQYFLQLQPRHWDINHQ